MLKKEKVGGFFERLELPLYFFDFETYASAIPIVDGISLQQQFPVQYSLHILNADGSLEQKEFLDRDARLPDRLVAQMETDFGETGSLISWHASFEISKIEVMKGLFPEKAEFLDHLIERAVDLEDVFKKDYVDARFDGSTSIKNVMQVLCCELSYSGLEVQDGTGAMEAWHRMLVSFGQEADKAAAELLEYCKLDSFAMVEIYRFLSRLPDL